MCDERYAFTCRVEAGVVEFRAAGCGAFADPYCLGKYMAAVRSGFESGFNAESDSGLDFGVCGSGRGFCEGHGGLGGGDKLLSDGQSRGGIGDALESDDVRHGVLGSSTVVTGFDRVPGADVARGCDVGRGHRVDSNDGEADRQSASRVCVDSSDGCVRGDGPSGLVGVTVRGKNYLRNKAKRDKAKVVKAGVRDLNEVCPSLSGSVRTVDTRTADEIEAANSLARRRVAENEVAIALAKHKLASLQDKSKTESLGRLAAARIEERINTAKAKSQASFKKCDESLKSLGSTGSAGEFALKKEVEKGVAWEVKYKYLEEQLKLAFPYIPDDVKQKICELPEPEFPNAHEIFGDCPSDYDDDEREAYYIELDRMNADAVCA